MNMMMFFEMANFLYNYEIAKQINFIFNASTLIIDVSFFKQIINFKKSLKIWIFHIQNLTQVFNNYKK